MGLKADRKPSRFHMCNSSTRWWTFPRSCKDIFAPFKPKIVQEDVVCDVLKIIVETVEKIVEAPKVQHSRRRKFRPWRRNWKRRRASTSKSLRMSCLKQGNRQWRSLNNSLMMRAALAMRRRRGESPQRPNSMSTPCLSPRAMPIVTLA